LSELIFTLHWDDAVRTLTIGAREESYPGMAAGHTFNVMIAAEGHGPGRACLDFGQDNSICWGKIEAMFYSGNSGQSKIPGF
jgi:hypothetical protein